VDIKRIAQAADELRASMDATWQALHVTQGWCYNNEQLTMVIDHLKGMCEAVQVFAIEVEGAAATAEPVKEVA
jgi:hypothetical protein